MTACTLTPVETDYLRSLFWAQPAGVAISQLYRLIVPGWDHVDSVDPRDYAFRGNRYSTS